MTLRTLTIAAIATLALAGTAVGCGDDDESPETATTTAAGS
jgi:hypothetical protein